MTQEEAYSGFLGLFFYLGLPETAGLERSQKKAHEFQISWKRAKRAKNMFNAQEQE